MYGPRQRNVNWSRLLLFGSWAFFGLIAVTIVVWLLVSGDSMEQEMAERQPKAVLTMTGSGSGSGSAPAAAPAAQKPKPGDPGRRVEKPDQPEIEGAAVPSEAKPLVSKPLKKAKLQLHPHPDPQLIEKAAVGPLPMIAKDGRQPWQVYSRPFSKLDKRPRIALVFTGLGVSANATESVIQNVPGSVTLAYAPFARRLKDWIDISRAAGHEVLVGLPMEPLDYPINDPGPYTLLTTLPEEQNKRRIHWVLSRLTGYVGVSTYMAGKFSAQPDAMEAVISELKSRGLLMLDIRENPLSLAGKLAIKASLPIAERDLYIDSSANRNSIRAKLAETEKLAKERGVVVAVARPFPVTVEEVSRWAKEVQKRGVVLAPLSAIAKTAAN